MWISHQTRRDLALSNAQSDFPAGRAAQTPQIEPPLFSVGSGRFHLEAGREGWREGQFFVAGIGPGRRRAEHDFSPDLKKIFRESVRGAAALGISIGAGAAFYARFLRMSAVGRLVGPRQHAAAVVPALGAGISVFADAATAKVFGRPTDPEGRSSPLLPWVSPAFAALAASSYRFAPLPKPRPGTYPDMLAQVMVIAAGGAAAYSTREWLAQRAVAQGKTRRVPREQIDPGLPDRFLGRVATQAVSAALRWQALVRPSRASELFLPVMFTTCVPFGWREEFSHHIARLRRSKPD